MRAQQTLHIAVVLTFLSPVVGGAEGSGDISPFGQLRDRIEVSALFTQVWALGTESGRSQKFESRFEPELNLELPFDLDLTAVGRLRSDAFDTLIPGQASQAAVSSLSRRLQIGSQVDLELREFYLEATLGRTFLTLGKQHIVWGKTEGLKVLDVVNPQDFREFVLEDFDESRIPLWAVNAEIPIKDIVLQLVWLPDQTYNVIPEADALYALTASMFKPKFPPGAIVERRPLRRPRHLLADSDAGLRLSAFWHGWDLTLNYLYHYHDNPVLFQKRSLSPEGSRVTVTPRYTRTHLVGGSFSNAFGDFTVRGEGGLSFDRAFATRDPANADGVIRSHELAYGLGLDWRGLDETLVSVQFFQNWIIGNTRGLLLDAIGNTVSFLFQRDFLNDSLIVRLLWIQNLDHGDGFVRPKLSYELRSNVLVWIGFDGFYGSRNGLFGEFAQHDRIVFGLEWGIGG